MEVIIIQIIIAAIIIIVGASGKKERDGISIILVVLTLLAVFMTWLIILQLITIAIAYQISSNIEENRNQHSNQQVNTQSISSHNLSRESNGNSLKSCVLVFIIILAIVSAISVFQHRKTKNVESTEVTEPSDTLKKFQSESIYYNPNENLNDSINSEIEIDSVSTEKSPVDYRYDDEHDDPQNERVYEPNEE